MCWNMCPDVVALACPPADQVFTHRSGMPCILWWLDLESWRGNSLHDLHVLSAIKLRLHTLP